MNEQLARSALRRPLTFGDDEQIRAIRFLDAVAEAVEAIKASPECEECGGRGEVEEPCELCAAGEGCDECDDGFNTETCLTCCGLGYFVIDWPACKDDVMEAAMSRIEKERLLS